MFRHILALPAGDDPEQPVLRRAALCAARTSAIGVLDVVYEPAVESYLGNEEVYELVRGRVLAEHERKAAALAAALSAHGHEAFGRAVWNRQREAAVEAYVRSHDVDLVVATPLDGGRGGLSGSDWRLMARCPAPVLLVKGSGRVQYRNVVAAVDPFHAHAKPAQLDAAILATAAELCAHTGARLTVLHCFTPPEYFHTDSRLKTRDEEFEAGRRQALGSLLSAAGIPESVSRVVPGAPHVEIQALAERGEADVIVMGALARGHLRDFIIGTTAERVLYRVAADVLAVNPLEGRKHTRIVMPGASSRG